MIHLQNCPALMIILLAPLVTSVSPAAAETADAPIRVLILTGSNNHNWKETTPMLQRILEQSGRFRVATTVPPLGLTKDNLQQYDVIVSNWNSWGRAAKAAEAEWTEAVRDAYLDFVRGGKGHVTVHAGGSSFYEGWPEYRQVALVYWDLGRTGHGRQHEFRVRFDQPQHAITAGLQEFVIRDELWNGPGVVQGATVLASAYSDSTSEARGSDQWEPSAVLSEYGQGRCFATLLGHDAKIMENKDFQQLLTRGVQWAATGKITPRHSTATAEP
jgi:type 1 glutamine amidotransferase